MQISIYNFSLTKGAYNINLCKLGRNSAAGCTFFAGSLAIVRFFPKKDAERKVVVFEAAQAEAEEMCAYTKN
jgi:hypothetical protein